MPEPSTKAPTGVITRQSSCGNFADDTDAGDPDAWSVPGASSAADTGAPSPPASEARGMGGVVRVADAWRHSNDGSNDGSDDAGAGSNPSRSQADGGVLVRHALVAAVVATLVWAVARRSAS